MLCMRRFFRALAAAGMPQGCIIACPSGCMAEPCHPGCCEREPACVRSGRFNERLVLSLASNTACLLMDDELNILPTSSHVASIASIPLTEDGLPDVPGAGGSQAELKELVESLKDTQVGFPLRSSAFMQCSRMLHGLLVPTPAVWRRSTV